MKDFLIPFDGPGGTGLKDDTDMGTPASISARSES